MRYTVTIAERSVEVDLTGPRPRVDGVEMDAELVRLPGSISHRDLIKMNIFEFLETDPARHIRVEALRAEHTVAVFDGSVTHGIVRRHLSTACLAANPLWIAPDVFPRVISCRAVAQAVGRSGVEKPIKRRGPSPFPRGAVPEASALAQ